MTEIYLRKVSLRLSTEGFQNRAHLMGIQVIIIGARVQWTFMTVPVSRHRYNLYHIKYLVTVMWGCRIIMLMTFSIFLGFFECMKSVSNICHQHRYNQIFRILRWRSFSFISRNRKRIRLSNSKFNVKIHIFFKRIIQSQIQPFRWRG